MPKRLGLISIFTLLACAAQAVDYDIVYVRQARFGDFENTTWPEVFHPARLDPGADLMLLHPDGSEEILVDTEHGGVTDPVVSFDGKSVYYSFFPDLRDEALNYQRQDLPYQGADIYRIDLDTRVITRLTHGGFTPNTGAGNWDTSNPVDPDSGYNRLGYGILNLGPMPVPGNKIAFTSNRNGFWPPKQFTAPTMQLYVMDHDGQNVTAIAPMSISSALHPTILRDGTLMFSSHESQGLRDRRLWGIWSIWPDGRNWKPVISAFNGPQAFHFMTQLSNGDLVVVDYYNLNNNGFGALYRMPSNPPAGTPAFFSAFPDDNPPIDQTTESGNLYPFRMPFTPWGLHNITPFTHGGDQAAPEPTGGGTRVGKFTHPSAAPDQDLLVVWTPGPANDLNRPTPMPYYDAGIYLQPGADIIWQPADLIEIKNDPAYNEAWPRAVVPYAAIHGVSEPEEKPWLPNDGSLNARLPAGTAYGLVGASSLYKRESFPGQVRSWSNTFDGLDAFNTSENGQSSNWFTQGADAGLYDDSDIWAIRIVAMEPNTHRSYGPNSGTHFESHANERLRILGEIPVRKFDEGEPILDPEGNPDTSFLVKIPADTPFTFQTIDRNGLLLNASQTWHQVRPGEVRTDCGGCHAHSQQPLAFAETAAADPDYPVYDLSQVTPLVVANPNGDPGLDLISQPVVDVEFLRDIRPLLQAHCSDCHSASNANPPAQLVLDDTAEINGLPGDYVRLAADSDAQFGLPPVISNNSWRQTNRSRYVRAFQSRRSLLAWKVFGERLDGWTNQDHPTESIPGDANTLPPDASANEADLDFTGTIMPPPASGVTPLTPRQRQLFARWIDLGAPINSGALDGNDAFGWFLDDQRPALTISSPRPNANVLPVHTLRFGVADGNSGVDPNSLSAHADFSVNNQPPGTELLPLFTAQGDGIYELDLDVALPRLSEATLTVSVADLQGNLRREIMRFRTTGDDVIFLDGFVR